MSCNALQIPSGTPSEIIDLLLLKTESPCQPGTPTRLTSADWARPHYRLFGTKSTFEQKSKYIAEVHRVRCHLRESGRDAQRTLHRPFKTPVEAAASLILACEVSSELPSKHLAPPPIVASSSYPESKGDSHPLRAFNFAGIAAGTAARNYLISLDPVLYLFYYALFIWCALGDDFRTWMRTDPRDWIRLQS